MPSRHLHLVVDDDLGPALWVREQTAPGRARAAEDLGALQESVPESLAAALAVLPDRLRHRVRLRGRAGAPDRRVPAAALTGPELVGLVEAVRALLEARFGEDALEKVSALIAQGTPVLLGEDVAAMPDLQAATVLDVEAARLVSRRDLRILGTERHGRAGLVWRGPDPDRPPLLDALVDARARAAFAAHVGNAGTTDGDRDGDEQDPLGVLPALTADGELDGDLPAQRAVAAALEAFRDSGRAVVLASTDDELVVRLFEPEPGSTDWLLQTCLRQEDGTVHPVDAPRAVGDLTPAGAAEAAAAIMQRSPVVRGARVDTTGLDWVLTTPEVSALLAEDAAALERAAVTVLLPRGWTAQRTTVRAEQADEPEDARKKGSGVGIGAMASFRWRVAVGDTELTEEEMEEIREAQSEIVHLRGQWVRLDTTTLRAAERFLDAFAARTGQPRRPRTPEEQAAAERRREQWRRAQDARRQSEAGGPGTPEPEPRLTPAEFTGDTTWAEIFSLLLSPDAADMGFAYDAMTSTGGEGLARLLPGGRGPETLPSPATLQATLRPYQQDGLDWMWALDRLGLGGILADDMGLGKTMQVLSLLCREREQGDDSPAPGPTLLVCPMSVVGAWQREAARFAPQLRVHVHHGGARLRDTGFAQLARRHDVVLTTYSLLARDLELLRSVPWHRIVLDEAQHVKNPGTQVTRAARSLQAPHRLAMTGTPVENRLGDLHSLMEVVNPRLLGSAAQFAERIADPIEEEGDEGALARLKFVTSPFVLRRVKTDRSIIKDLPEKTELTRVVNLTPEQAGLYEAIVEELMSSVDGAAENQRRALVVSTLTRLKQVCNHPAHYLGDGSALVRGGAHRSGKLELVDDLLENAFADGEKVLLFTQFTQFGHLLAPYWEERFAGYGIDVPFLHGGVAKPDRDAMVARFQERTDEPGLMLLSLRAGGTGLTLTAANHVVHLDRWWNPAVENQATDRAFRIGQRRDVTVHKLVSAGTVEERIDGVLADKQQLADLTIAPGEDWIASLDDAALRDLLSLDAADSWEGDG